MKNRFRKFLYFLLAIYALFYLVFICIIDPLPHNLLSFLYIFLWIVFGIKFLFKYINEKENISIKNLETQIQKVVDKYPSVKESVDTMTDIIYNNWSNSNKSSMFITINLNDYYLSDFYNNLEKLSKSNHLELDELTNFQKSACLIDSLCASKSWILQSFDIKDFDNLEKNISLNVELAVKSGLLFCGFTIDEINNMPIYTNYIKIIMYESIHYNSLGSPMVLSTIADFLEVFNFEKH